MTALIHATYGVSQLYFESLKFAGFRPTEIDFVCTQPAELAIIKRLGSRGEVHCPAARPLSRAVPWRNAPSPLLLKLLTSAPFDLADLMSSDRHLRRWPVDVSVHWLNTIAGDYLNLLRRRQPEVILGETANASEHILRLAAESEGVPYVWPSTLRVPSDLAGLWSGPRSETLWYPSGDVSASDTRPSDRKTALKPYYFERNSTPPRNTARLVSQPIGRIIQRELVDKRFKMQMPRPMDYLTLPWLNRVRKVKYAQTVSRRVWDEVPAGNFVFFPLHVQPESSIDLYPAPWRDQLGACEAMAEALSDVGLTLAVKDHPNFLWSRGQYFHDSLAKIPNVAMVSPNESAIELAEQALCTVTVSGTIALEAGLIGVRALMVSEHPWLELPTVHPIKRPTEIVSALRSVQALVPDPQAVSEWSQRYASGGREFVASEAFSMPEVLHRSNTETLGQLLREFLNDRSRAVS